MIIKKKENYTILTDQFTDIEDFSKYLAVQIPKRFDKENILVDLLKYETFSLEDLLLFINTSTIHRKSKKSFVIVNNTINPDVVPAEIIVVPTLQEGQDIIEMEEIERDLGF